MPPLFRSTRRHVWTRRSLVMLALTNVTSSLLAQSVTNAPCVAGRSSPATIGVGSYVCYGGDCILFDHTADGLRHTFTVEPMVRDVLTDGPAGGKLRDGDVIIAVDGALITTAEAGRKLASPVAGRVLRFRVRRQGAEREADVTPTAGCETPGISIADNALEEARGREIARTLATTRHVESGRVRAPLRAARPEEIPVDLGMTLDCTDCGWRLPLTGGALRWHSADPPRVVDVEPGGPAARAGLRPGDVLDTIDGAPFVGGDESTVWSALRANKTAVLRVRRGARIMDVVITPRRPPRNRM
jgi:S1-C subfamily serine protease